MACLSYLDELIERKVTGAEQGTLDASDLAFYQHEYQRLVVELESAHQSSHLPETATARPALHDLLLRVRLAAPTAPTEPAEPNAPNEFTSLERQFDS